MTGLDPKALSVDDFEELFPTLSFAEWLPAALADLCCAVVNLTRTGGQPVKRAEVLESWGLHAQAGELRDFERVDRDRRNQENMLQFLKKVNHAGTS